MRINFCYLQFTLIYFYSVPCLLYLTPRNYRCYIINTFGRRRAGVSRNSEVYRVNRIELTETLATLLIFVVLLTENRRIGFIAPGPRKSYLQLPLNDMQTYAS